MQTQVQEVFKMKKWFSEEARKKRAEIDMKSHGGILIDYDLHRKQKIDEGFSLLFLIIFYLFIGFMYGISFTFEILKGVVQ
jgi:hypothetical protein